MKLTINNIEKEVAKVANKLGVKFVVCFDCGNAYVNVDGSLNAITTICFDEDNNLLDTYTTQYKEEILDDNDEPTGEFEDCDNVLYIGKGLTAALTKLKLAA